MEVFVHIHVPFLVVCKLNLTYILAFFYVNKFSCKPERLEYTAYYVDVLCFLVNAWKSYSKMWQSLSLRLPLKLLNT